MKYFLELKKPNKKLLKSKNFNQITRTTGTNFLAFPCIFQLFLNSIFTSWLGIRIQEGTRMRNRIHSPDNIPYIQITPTSYCQKRLNELSKFTRVFFLHDSHEISYATYLWRNSAGVNSFSAPSCLGWWFSPLAPLWSWPPGCQSVSSSQPAVPNQSPVARFLRLAGYRSMIMYGKYQY